ncbi:MAG: hypothetical protein A2Y64_07250 [Candidatus Coatesbacteria bacterium RBG_13_66_14]|uniref:DUF3828 domain-containing protein n=1 Tax=Candidatus Coatesbacteria bacterium RBG_13_66_14 TaxID=1817816 RepID=A0A1F5F3G6_9BACT|nr:MAG: hypothetical protein A2Y64_07250 [Candidatus Coatesbacteria bacterium RBG_13_66_14]
MKILSFVIACAAVFILLGCFDKAEGQGPGFSPPEGSYDDGYNQGFKEGYQMGYSDGFTAGGGSSGGDTGDGEEVDFEEEEEETETILGPAPDKIVQQFIDGFKAENEAACKALFAKDSPQLKTWDSDWDQMQSANWSNWKTPTLHDHDSREARVTVKCSVKSFLGDADVRVFIDLVTRDNYWKIYEITYSSY